MFLAPENLVVKEINGTPITCRGLVECFKVCMYVTWLAPTAMWKAVVHLGMDVCVCGFNVYSLFSLQSYMKIFKGKDLPEPKGMLQVRM
jgi:hypothetical protein